jgi:hypothetical protein
MVTICDLVCEAFATQVLSIDAEIHLRQLLQTHYTTEDLNAYCSLRQAMIQGTVRQESREMRDLQFEPTRDPNR